ncbi:S8 family peptidase [Umezawaea sp. Da 62-37]|uniref:S8 family peptidase n=1 Tax=Umezawaea sp. Da 62-37 TaxID=3075927 RepID=UPI0028F6F004|nr:S8 family peptidase [Umezawaea sp. Da 62-37]WNV90528.1 S8 family peptidase [Umezawaea sp. Da 62-37]
MMKQLRRGAVVTALGLTGAVLFAPVVTAAAPPEEAVLVAPGAETVPGSYLVVYKDGATGDANTLATRYQGELGRSFSSALHGFSVRGLSEQQARRLAADPAVDYVEQNAVVRLQDTQTDPIWNLDRIDQRALPLDRKYTYDNTASNVTAYVIDTGIRKSHSEFEGRASSGYDFVDNDSDATDCNGHGTHVAGTVAGKTYGVAKKARIVSLRVLGCDGTGSFEGIISAIDWVTSNGVKPGVVNMSLGGNGSNATMENAVRRSIAAGFTYALAGGNNGQDACGFTPARTPEAITVGAVDQAGKRSVWNSSASSNYGTCLDIWAPGTAIRSASYSSDTGYTEMGGTSMASPHVAGAAALYLGANPGATPKQVRDALVASATGNILTDVKTGSPNLFLYTGSGGTTPPNPPNPPTGKLTAALSPAAQTIGNGQVGRTTVTVQGGAGAVRLSATGGPQGSLKFFQPTTIPAAGSSQLSVYTGFGPGGTFPITITATDGVNSATTTFTLTVG